MNTIALVKYTLLLLSSPIWLPFVKELWAEFQLAMREDGGLWGPSPTPRMRKEISEQLAREPLRQVHIPKGHLGMRRRLPQQDSLASGPQIGGPRTRNFKR